MKPNKTKIFIAVSSLALLIVLIIQVNWILDTAKMKEELFNERANMVLARTTEALCADKVTCQNMSACLGVDEISKIDSLFGCYMKFYNFHVEYSFEVVQPDKSAALVSELVSNFNQKEQGCYKKNLDELASTNGLQLKLILPEKRQYIMAEMGPMFISSVILILVVLVMFWRTTRSLMMEKQISEHTTEFLNNMTHEFKTPLTNIGLAGKMIMKDPGAKQEERIMHYSGIILEENEKLRMQVDQVLSMTALERGEIPLQKSPLDFHQLIEDALKCIRIQIESNQGSLSLNLAADDFMVNGDRVHLTNTLCNLIDNGIKYSPGKPEISIETSNRDQQLIITISDRGMGIKREYQKRVFEKFFRVPTGDVHDVKGFGLGLSYVKKIVELHGGTIELKSDPGNQREGNGTKFIIALPHA